MSDHHVSEDGQTIVCTAAPEAECRTRTLCDSATWNFDGCDDHHEEHQSVPGQPCWQIEWVNRANLDDTQNERGYQGRPDPGTPVELEWDDGITWSHEEAGSDE